MVWDCICKKKSLTKEEKYFCGYKNWRQNRKKKSQIWKSYKNNKWIICSFSSIYWKTLEHVLNSVQLGFSSCGYYSLSHLHFFAFFFFKERHAFGDLLLAFHKTPSEHRLYALATPALSLQCLFVSAVSQMPLTHHAYITSQTQPPPPWETGENLYFQITIHSPLMWPSENSQVLSLWLRKSSIWHLLIPIVFLRVTRFSK